MTTTQINARIDEALKNAIDEYCRSRGIVVNHFVQQTLIDRLAEEPRPRECRKLAGYDDAFRIRVGRFKVIYSISDTRRVVLILKIGHSRKVYQ